MGGGAALKSQKREIARDLHARQLALRLHSSVVVLRITERRRKGKRNGVAVLSCEGRLTGPWVHELRRAVAGSIARSGRARLDLTAVTYVDSDGEQLLGELTTRGVEVAGTSSFVAELLKARATATRKARKEK